MLSLTPNPDAPLPEAVQWDPADPQEFIDFARGQWVGQAGDRAVVQTQGTRLPDGTVASGHVLTLDKGWWAVRPKGTGPGNVAFAEPGAVGGPLSQWSVAPA